MYSLLIGGGLYRMSFQTLKRILTDAVLAWRRRGEHDTITAGNGRDLLEGGPGRDTIKAGGGNDRIEARDGFRDVIDCGPGNDTAEVDRLDVVRSCEHVLRP
jgi:Ca2+-binding RTX toxin-like protein